MRGTRTAAAFLLAPIMVPIVFAVGARIRRQFPFLGPPPIPEASVIFINIVLPIAYVSALVFGVPALLVFRRRRWQRFSAFALGGAVAGLFAGTLLSMSEYVGEGYRFLFAACTVAGALSALAFRAVHGAWA